MTKLDKLHKLVEDGPEKMGKRLSKIEEKLLTARNESENEDDIQSQQNNSKNELNRDGVDHSMNDENNQNEGDKEVGSLKDPSPTEENFNQKEKDKKLDDGLNMNDLQSRLKVNAGVEIRLNSTELHGPWYPGLVVDVILDEEDSLKMEVEFTALYSDTGNTKLSKRLVNKSELRPLAPLMSKSEKKRNLKVGTEVDVFHNDGWWEGTVTVVGVDGNFCVSVKALDRAYI